ncbi:MAG: HPr family phosphocarrier protein [Telmatospirillum sp.]|nr:HPr family phosphocarrier protein [Telmatospirillum sp.]
MTDGAEGDAGDSTSAVIARTATIPTRRGLHARAAAKFVKLATQFQAQVLVSNRGIEVSGLSIMGLMMLAAGPGSSIELKGTGVDAVQAVDALTALIDAKFDED